VCVNRILVQDGVYDAFTKRLGEIAGAMKVADGFEPGAVIGPLIDMKTVEKVEAHIADAVKKGAKVVTGGKRAALPEMALFGTRGASTAKARNAASRRP
jgi:succinate-semialdehyde dehydrogenase/glutarate-semialdehyde dehydrogenase